MDEILKTLESENERVLIVRRRDGAFSYRRQIHLFDGWGDPGPMLGLYDTAATAEIEARARVWWLSGRTEEGG